MALEPVLDLIDPLFLTVNPVCCLILSMSSPHKSTAYGNRQDNENRLFNVIEKCNICIGCFIFVQHAILNRIPQCPLLHALSDFLKDLCHNEWLEIDLSIS